MGLAGVVALFVAIGSPDELRTREPVPRTDAAASAPARGRAAGPLEMKPRQIRARPPSPASLSTSPPGPAPQPSPPSIEDDALALGLHPRPGGAYGYVDPDHRFEATILHDGTVEFELPPNVQFKLDGVCAVAVCLRTKFPHGPSGPEAAGEERRAQVGARVAMTAAAIVAESLLGTLSQGTFVYGQSRVHPPITIDPRDRFPYVPVGTVQGRYGTLPTPVQAMTEFMELTFDLRLRMVHEAMLANMQSELDRLPAELEALWQDPVRSPEARRAAILKMWADLEQAHASHRDRVLDDASAPGLAQERREFADLARARIAAFVRERAPSAFSREELDAFNRRADVRIPFEPYRVRAETGP